MVRRGEAVVYLLELVGPGGRRSESCDEFRGGVGRGEGRGGGEIRFEGIGLNSVIDYCGVEEAGKDMDLQMQMRMQMQIAGEEEGKRGRGGKEKREKGRNGEIVRVCVCVCVKRVKSGKDRRS